MGLDCDNDIMIVCDNQEQLNTIYNKYFNGLNTDFCKIKSMNENMIKVWLYSRNTPFIDLPQEILQNFTQIWVKLNWCCENGQSGICVGGYKSNIYYPYRTFEYQDLCIEERFMYSTESNKRLRT